MNLEDFENQPYSQLATKEDIYHCYRLILGRNPDVHGWKQLAARIGELRLEGLVLTFLTHPEFKNRAIFEKMLGQDESLPVVAECDGFKLYVSPNDTSIGAGILTSGVHEPQVTQAISKTLRSAMVFVDIGANTGYFSILAAKLVGTTGRVIAFEPDQRNCLLLQLSAQLNHLSNVDIYPFAVADQDATVVYDRLLGSNGIISQALEVEGCEISDLAHRTLVRAVQLDTILGALPRLDVIKMDIEGAEYRALVGAEDLIARHRPIQFLEYSPGLLPGISGVSGKEYLRKLVDLGYALSILVSDGAPVDCKQDVQQVLEYYEMHTIDHLDLMARPTKRRRFWDWPKAIEQS